jgi:hypothetical protein
MPSVKGGRCAMPSLPVPVSPTRPAPSPRTTKRCLLTWIGWTAICGQPHPQHSQALQRLVRHDLGVSGPPSPAARSRTSDDLAVPGGPMSTLIFPVYPQYDCFCTWDTVPVPANPCWPRRGGSSGRCCASDAEGPPAPAASRRDALLARPRSGP